MSAATIVTLLGVGLIVASLVVYLVRIAWSLKEISFDLGTIVAGTRAMAYQSEPVAQILGEINHELEQTRSGLAGLLAAPRRLRPASRHSGRLVLTPPPAPTSTSGQAGAKRRR